VSADGVSRC
jgi:hypothetical protein